jgi:hypothetical protein
MGTCYARNSNKTFRYPLVDLIVVYHLWIRLIEWGGVDVRKWIHKFGHATVAEARGGRRGGIVWHQMPTLRGTP